MYYVDQILVFNSWSVFIYLTQQLLEYFIFIIIIAPLESYHRDDPNGTP